MRRGKGQRSLYEVMSQTRSKPKRSSMLRRLRPPVEKLRMPSFSKLSELTGSAVEKLRQATARETKPSAEAPRPMVESAAAPVVPPPPKRRAEGPKRPSAQGPAQTWLKPKAFQFNEGRIEISVPWQAGVFIALVMIFVLVVTFQLGRLDERARFGAGATTQSDGAGESPRPATRETGANSARVSDSSAGANAGAGATAAQGDHVIVLAQYQTQAPLVPVQEHFDRHGISTGIVTFSRLREYFAERGLNASVLPQGDGYMLITTTMYNNPGTPGTDGHAVKERIKQIGALYKGKAPEGYESFAPNYFSDAYGMRIR